MPSNVVQVPASLLLTHDLAPRAKLVWMVSRLPAGPGRPAGNTGLAAASGLSRPTVIKGLAQLTASGWISAQDCTEVTVPVPANLLANRNLGPGFLKNPRTGALLQFDRSALPPNQKVHPRASRGAA